jgi:hypothetical protein
MVQNNALSSFADYKATNHNWITLASGEYYPDILEDAQLLYEPVLVLFSQLLKSSESSVRLLMNIAEVPEMWMRIQLARIFRKYVSPSTPVEMLKKKSKVKEICDQFGHEFRPIHLVQSLFCRAPYQMKRYVHYFGNIKAEGKKVMI